MTIVFTDPPWLSAVEKSCLVLPTVCEQRTKGFDDQHTCTHPRGVPEIFHPHGVFDLQHPVACWSSARGDLITFFTREDASLGSNISLDIFNSTLSISVVLGLLLLTDSVVLEHAL